MLDNKYSLDIYFDGGKIKKKIELNKDARLILDLSEIKIDSILIEILYEDNIDEEFFIFQI